MNAEHIKAAREALDNMDDYARMNTGVDAHGPRGVLVRFINEAERTTAPVSLTDAQIIQRAGEIFGFKPHKQDEVTKARYVDFARWTAAVPAFHADQLIGMPVSMDVSTGDDDADHRVFGKVIATMPNEGGITLLAEEESRNFAAADHQQQEPPKVAAAHKLLDCTEEEYAEFLGWEKAGKPAIQPQPVAEQGGLPPAEHDKDMDRHYLPLPNGWEVQTKGHGSTFRIAHVPTGARYLVLDENLHEPLESLARDVRAAIAGGQQAAEQMAWPEWLKIDGDTILIHGIRYDQDLFLHFGSAMPLGEPFMLDGREKDGALTVLRLDRSVWPVGAKQPTQAAQDVAPEVAREEWSYSTNEEDYQEQEPSRLAILQHALSELGDDHEGSFWIGRNKRFTGRGDAVVVIDYLREQAYDECGEYAETYLDDVKEEDCKELADYISDWAARVDRSNFWTVEDVEHHTVESARAAIAKEGGA